MGQQGKGGGVKPTSTPTTTELNQEQKNKVETMGNTHKYTYSDGGEKVTIELTETENKDAISACERNGVDRIYLMRKGKGALLMFIEERAARHTCARQKFDAYFCLSVEEMKKGGE